MSANQMAMLRQHFEERKRNDNTHKQKMDSINFYLAVIALLMVGIVFYRYIYLTSIGNRHLPELSQAEYSLHLFQGVASGMGAYFWFWKASQFLKEPYNIEHLKGMQPLQWITRIILFGDMLLLFVMNLCADDIIRQLLFHAVVIACTCRTMYRLNRMAILAFKVFEKLESERVE